MMIELAPELEAEVTRAAAASGVAPERYVNEVVAGSLEWRRDSDPRREDIRMFLNRLAGMAKPVDTLNTETFSREMIYADDIEKFNF